MNGINEGAVADRLARKEVPGLYEPPLMGIRCDDAPAVLA